MLILSACGPISPPPIHLQKSELENKIVKVELIHYENPDQEFYKKYKSYTSDHFKELPSYDESNETILKELPPECISDFLDRVSEAEILPVYFFCDSPKCLCMKLTYNDESFLILDAGSKSVVG